MYMPVNLPELQSAAITGLVFPPSEANLVLCIIQGRPKNRANFLRNLNDNTAEIPHNPTPTQRKHTGHYSTAGVLLC